MKRFGSEKGAALMICMIVVMILMMLTVSVLTQATGKVHLTDGRLVDAELLQAAETGLDAGILEMNGHDQDAAPPDILHDGNVGTDGWSLASDTGIPVAGDPDRIADGIPNFDEAGVAPLTYGGVEYYSWAEFFCNDGLDNDGNGLLDTVGVDVAVMDAKEVYYARLLVFTRQATGPAARRREAVYEAVLKSAGAVRDHDFFFFPYAAGSCNQLHIPNTVEFGGEDVLSYYYVYKCQQCGKEFTEPTSPCPNCGNSSKTTYKCRSCGAVFDTQPAGSECPTCGYRRWFGSFYSTISDTWYDRIQMVDPTGEYRDSDRIVGDIFVDGFMSWDKGAMGEGRLQATKEILGDPGPGAQLFPGADRIAPPDLSSANYSQLCDYAVVDGDPDLTTHGTAYGTIETYKETDPRHIFAKNWRTDLGDIAKNRLNNGTGAPVPQWQMADTYNSINGGGYISIHPTEGTDKIYYIKGDLWLEGQDTGSYCAHYMFIDDPPEGSRITVVVEGNIYFADDFWVVKGDRSVNASPPALTDSCKNAIAFIAISGGQETFTDLDGDWEYDAGEPILNDDGDGVYEGPRCGAGNIMYGDPNAAAVAGQSQAFFYAENNFQDYALDGDGNPLEVGITGLMSAGGILSINRDFGTDHAKMTVEVDTRLHRKLVSLPGLPNTFVEGSTYPIGPFKVISWRRLR